MKSSYSITFATTFAAGLLLAVDARWKLGMPRPIAMGVGFFFGAGIVMFFYTLLLNKFQVLKKRQGLPPLAEDLPDDVYVVRQLVEICPGETWGAIVTSTRKRPESHRDLRFVWSREPIPKTKRFATGATSERIIYPLAEIPSLDEDEQLVES